MLLSRIKVRRSGAVRWWSELPVVAKMRENGRPPTVIFEGGSSKGVVMGSRGGAWSGDRCVDVMRSGLVPEESGHAGETPCMQVGSGCGD